MELRDLIVTPLLLILVIVVAYIVRPYVTDLTTRRYFIPALSVRIIGALAVGFIYQFYYNGGDTYNYHNFGSRIIWEAFWDSPEVGFKLLLSDGSSHEGVYKYSSRIPFYTDWNSYNIIRLAAVFDLFTFSTYSATAVMFGVFSFIGMWMFFLTFYHQYPHLHKGLAIASFFIPSVFFWGSGLLKDTVALTFLGMNTYLTSRIFFERKYNWFTLLFFLFCLYGLYSIKVYIFLNFVPAAIFWIFLRRFETIHSPALKAILLPFVVVTALTAGYFAVSKASEDNPRYAISKLAETARITAYDIRFYTGKDAGSGYTLGELDGSFASMLAMAPQAINVSLFRPYLWEVNNPLMLLSALESLAILLATLYMIFSLRSRAFHALGNADIMFALIFAISFAFAVGVSTFNFGTLVRYKIPVLPFLITALVLIYDHAKRQVKASALLFTE